MEGNFAIGRDSGGVIGDHLRNQNEFLHEAFGLLDCSNPSCHLKLLKQLYTTSFVDIGVAV